MPLLPRARRTGPAAWLVALLLHFSLRHSRAWGRGATIWSLLRMSSAAGPPQLPGANWFAWYTEIINCFYFYGINFFTAFFCKMPCVHYSPFC
ncbi:hypothetical protein GCM10027594_35230 [Hymenobacter agri]